MTLPERLWAEYRKLVYPEGTTPDQEHHCRAAFVAGMKASLIALDNFAERPEGAGVMAIEEFNRDVCAMANKSTAESIALEPKTKNPDHN